MTLREERKISDMRFIFLCQLLLLASVAQAQIKSTNEATLGFTDNANYEDGGRDSDFFLRFSTSNSYKSGEQLFGLRLSYSDFFKEHQNDHFSFRISDRWSPSNNGWSFVGALLGRQYTSEGPGYTETAFNNWGLDLSAEKSKAIASRTDLTFGPTLRGRYYSGAASRSDHTLSGAADLTHELNSRLALIFSTELGVLTSSDSNFSRMMFDLSAAADFQVSSELQWYSEIGLSYSGFSDRSVAEQTIVSNRRGTFRTITTVENEAYDFFYLTTELKKAYSENVEGKVSFNHTSQSSRSGFQNFAVNEFLMSGILTF